MASSLSKPRLPASFAMLLACGASSMLLASRTCADLHCSVLGYGPGSCECMRECRNARLRLGRQAGRQAGRYADTSACRQAGRFLSSEDKHRCVFALQLCRPRAHCRLAPSAAVPNRRDAGHESGKRYIAGSGGLRRHHIFDQALCGLQSSHWQFL